MEEDTGKSLHVGGATGRIHGADHSLVDYNRAGMPLIEIVTKPIEGTGRQGAGGGAGVRDHAARPAARARASPTSGWSRARCAATRTCRCGRRPDAPFGTRTETKNVNSLRSVERAVRYEITRQAAVLDARRHGHAGDPALARGHRRSPRPGRSKEDAEDYRYFPEPDLVPVAPTREWVEELRATLPEPPGGRLRPAAARSGASPSWSCGTWSTPARVDADRGDGRGRGAARRRPQVVADRDRPARPTRPAWSSPTLGDHPGAGRRGAGAGRRAARSTTSWPARCSRACWPARATPAEVVAARGLAVVSDDGALGAAVDAAIAANPDVAEKIRAGKVQAAGALIGAVMKAMRGQADAGRVRELILERLPGPSRATSSPRLRTADLREHRLQVVLDGVGGDEQLGSAMSAVECPAITSRQMSRSRGVNPYAASSSPSSWSPVTGSIATATCSSSAPTRGLAVQDRPLAVGRHAAGRGTRRRRRPARRPPSPASSPRNRPGAISSSRSCHSRAAGVAARSVPAGADDHDRGPAARRRRARLGPHRRPGRAGDRGRDRRQELGLPRR